jgi:PAS domain S-box-containing protein
MICAIYIDDDPILLEIAKAFLEIDGEITVDTATSAMEALVKLETNDYDAVICDFQMPMVDGLEFLKTLRLQGRDVPFILFTGKGREDVAIQALNNGADFYLQKGGDPKSQFVELKNMLIRSVGQRRAEESAKDSEEIYEKLFKDNIEAMILVDPKTGRIADANLTATRFSGYPRERLVEMSVQELGILPPGKNLQAVGQDRPKIGDAKVVTKFRCANGKQRDVEIFSGKLRVHGRSMGYAIIHDITESILAAKRERRLHLVFKVLSDTSQMIIRARDEMELVEGTCKILVEQGEYDQVWIGACEPDGKTFRTIGLAAANGRETDDPRASIDAEGGPAHEALHQRKAVIAHDAKADPFLRRHPDPAEGEFFSSSITLPLILDGAAQGVLCIYSTVPEAFEGAEGGLLQNMANNLSEAIDLFSRRGEEGSASDGRAPGPVILDGITEIDPALNSLKENERRLREITEGMLDIVVKFDAQGTILFVSPSVKDVLGVEAEELVGRPIFDYIHPEDVGSVRKVIGRAVEERRTRGSAKLRLRAHGSYLKVEAVGRPFYDENGRLVAVVSSVRDMSEAQQAEDLLWEAGGKLRAIIQTSPLAILSLDPEGRVSTWNPAAERIFDWDEVSSTRPFSFLPKGSSETEELRSAILRGDKLTDVEVVRKYPDGQERTVSISTAPILDQAGRVVSIILVGSDTSERKRMEDRLIQLNEVLRLVNGILRHDTLNELMVVNGSLEMYQKTKQEKYLATASKAIDRSVEMIKRMKELESLAVSGGSFREYDLHQVVEDILRGYMVEFQVTGEAKLFADDALPSAIDNIVRNALVHGMADHIDAKIWKESGSTYLSIADNGIGIPDSIKQSIFGEGFSYGKKAGSGLGLYLVSKAVERYGGKVRVEDNQPKGAVFVFSFPNT